MRSPTDGWLPSINGLLRASTCLWLSAPFLQPLYLRSGVAGSQVLFLGFWGAFGAFLGVGRSRSVRISLPRTSCIDYVALEYSAALRSAHAGSGTSSLEPAAALCRGG